MWEMVTDIRSAIPLAAFVIAALLAAYRAYLGHKEKVISSADNDRAVQLAATVLGDNVQLDLKKLSRDQLFSLAQEKLKLQSTRLLYLTVSSMLIAVLSAVLIALAITSGQGNAAPDTEVEQIQSEPIDLSGEWEYYWNNAKFGVIKVEQNGSALTGKGYYAFTPKGATTENARVFYGAGEIDQDTISYSFLAQAVADLTLKEAELRYLKKERNEKSPGIYRSGQADIIDSELVKGVIVSVESGSKAAMTFKKCEASCFEEFLKLIE